jgi:hypothetical protein
MVTITQPISLSAFQKSPAVPKQSSVTKPTHEPNFGLTTVSFGKASPITPRPVQPKTQGTRLDYYA